MSCAEHTQHKSRRPFKWCLVDASKGHVFSMSISTTLVETEHTTEEAAFLADCGQCVGATQAETAQRKGAGRRMEDSSQMKTAPLCGRKPDVRCGLLKDERRVRRTLGGHEYMTECVTVLRDELQWLDIIRRPTAAANVEGVATSGGFSALLGEKEKTTKHGNIDEIGPNTVKPISFELGGRPGPQTMIVLQGLTT